MKTKVILLNPKKTSKKELAPAVKLLKRGEIVAFPTETVYGLGANAFDAKAVEKIFKAKGRPQGNPLIVHISNKNQLRKVVSGKISKTAKKLMNKFWPGPLTIVLNKSTEIPCIVTAGLDTVAVRMPSNKIASLLIKECGFPIAAPSANTSSKPSSTHSDHVFEDLNGKIPIIISQPLGCEIGLESTIVDLSGEIPVLLRPGKITLEQLKKIIGKIEIHSSAKGKKIGNKIVKAPGMKYRHYTPKAKIILVTKGDFRKVAARYLKKGKIEVISFSRPAGIKECGRFFIESYYHSGAEYYSKYLFDGFRRSDSLDIDYIIIEAVSEKGIGFAVMNRLRKAAWKII